MLRCNMNIPDSPALMRDLEDVLGSMKYARRTNDLGRLALLTYWEVRRWARCAHRDALAGLAADAIMAQPHPSRESFLALVDQVICELERVQSTAGACPPAGASVRSPAVRAPVKPH